MTGLYISSAGQHFALEPQNYPVNESSPLILAEYQAHVDKYVILETPTSKMSQHGSEIVSYFCPCNHEKPSNYVLSIH